MDIVLFRYRFRFGANRNSTFEFLYGVKPRSAVESVVDVRSEDAVLTVRIFDLSLDFTIRAEHLCFENSTGMYSTIRYIWQGIAEQSKSADWI